MPDRRMVPRAVFVLLAALCAAWLAAGCLEASVPVENRDAEEAASLQEELQARIQYVRDNASSLASHIHRLINEERGENGLHPLEWDQRLANIALSHSRDMATRGYFDHVDPEGEDFADRYREHGYNLQTRIGDQVLVGGENLFLNNVVNSYTYDRETQEVYEYQYNGLEELALSTVEGWMRSPGHRENILTPFTREGIGIYVSDEGKVYITENFS